MILSILFCEKLIEISLNDGVLIDKPPIPGIIGYIPIDANTTMIREIAYALPDERRETKAAQYLNWRINRQVNNEDTDLINLVQEGMNTSHFRSGPLASSEVCLIDSANKIREAIPISRQELKPKESRIFKENFKL